jgi:excisionase family DNA binding protein
MRSSNRQEPSAEVGEGESMDEDRLLTPKEVAERLGKHEKTVIRWCREGYLPCKRFGHLWQVLASELEKWMADPPPYPSRRQQ